MLLLITLVIADRNTTTSSKYQFPLPPAPPLQVQLYLAKVRREGTARVRMFLVVSLAYLLFWGPLFLVTLANWQWTFEDAKQSMAHEVTDAFLHCTVHCHHL